MTPEDQMPPGFKERRNGLPIGRILRKRAELLGYPIDKDWQRLRAVLIIQLIEEVRALQKVVPISHARILVARKYNGPGRGAGIVVGDAPHAKSVRFTTSPTGLWRHERTWTRSGETSPDVFRIDYANVGKPKRQEPYA